MFDDARHTMIMSEDGSYTAYSKEYNEHYHSTKDGALHESLVKHVYPAFEVMQNKEEIYILDICFGLGLNTLSTLYYHKKNNLTSKLFIYSPELDASLVHSLKNFIYPAEFDSFKHIIKELAEKGIYEDDSWHVEIFLGDAREYIRTFPHAMFDIVYQDAFSPSSNPILWTQEYFGDIRKIMKEEGILTTYSIALPIRLALYENGFYIYLHSAEEARKSTVASLQKLSTSQYVDMEHKISCNPHAKPLRDAIILSYDDSSRNKHHL